MQKIPTTMARPGMVLARPVTRDNGMTIMAQGMELTQGHIDRLENMDIERIVVQGRPVDLGDAGADTSFAARGKRLDHLFAQYDDDAWMTKLKASLKKYFRLRAAQQQAEELCEENPEACDE